MKDIESSFIKRLVQKHIAEHLAHNAVDLNSATEARLARLPGIGPVKAKAIVTNRIANGPISSIDELSLIKGIGPAAIDIYRPYTRV